MSTNLEYTHLPVGQLNKSTRQRIKDIKARIEYQLTLGVYSCPREKQIRELQICVADKSLQVADLKNDLREILRIVAVAKVMQ